jgi:N-methylhydantoinase B/oxoprolinase/acetone carboxylase alpha subunit
MAVPGGGGYGNPRDRDPALIARDVALGYVSMAAAKSDYGIDISEGFAALPVSTISRGNLHSECLERSVSSEYQGPCMGEIGQTRD